jgi:hypothetical protein
MFFSGGKCIFVAVLVFTCPTDARGFFINDGNTGNDGVSTCFVPERTLFFYSLCVFKNPEFFL